MMNLLIAIVFGMWADDFVIGLVLFFVLCLFKD